MKTLFVCDFVWLAKMVGQLTNSWTYHQLKWDYNASPSRNTVSILYNMSLVQWGSNASIMAHFGKRLLAYLTNTITNAPHHAVERLWQC